MDSNPIHHPSPPKNMKCLSLYNIQHLMLARLVNGLEPHPPPLSSPKNEMLIFGLCSTSDNWNGWLMDSNPICQPSPATKMKCFFLDYVQLLMIGLAGWWTRTPSASPLQPKKWNATFWITFNFWWLAGLVNGLKPHPPPLSSQRNEMLIFVLCSTSNDQPGLSMDLNPIHHLCPAKKWNAHILIMFNFWWLAGLVDGLKPHPPLLSSWKHEMLVFVLHSTSDVGQAAQWTWTPSATLFRQKNEMLIFGLHSTSDDWLAGWWTQTPSTTPLQSKNEILIFGLRSTSDNQPGWSMDSNPICHPSLANKMKCSFLDYVELLIIGQAGWWTQTPSATPLQLIKWNAHFWNTFNFWWSAWLVNGLEPHLPALSSQKNEMLLFGLHSTSDDRLGWLMDSNPICQPSPAKKMKCYFLDYVQLLMIGWASQWTQTPSSTSLQPKKWNAHFCIMFNF